MAGEQVEITEEHSQKNPVPKAPNLLENSQTPAPQRRFSAI
jgi:hypothetical protein